MVGTGSPPLVVLDTVSGVTLVSFVPEAVPAGLVAPDTVFVSGAWTAAGTGEFGSCALTRHIKVGAVKAETITDVRQYCETQRCEKRRRKGILCGTG
jgi:hypothetical protein